ncbi:hypothetical protein Scep_026417 [Stephania cephalantha]|uniref:Uncharacterized protein n=1 Tax=Stephania cephalantha TaxID=152367 RepID=A0AAP0HN58_9MAGN
MEAEPGQGGDGGGVSSAIDSTWSDTGDQLATKDPVDLDSGIDYGVLECVVRRARPFVRARFGYWAWVAVWAGRPDPRWGIFDGKESPPLASPAALMDDYMTIFYSPAIMAVGGCFCPPAFSYYGVRVCRCRSGSHIRMTGPPPIFEAERHRADRIQASQAVLMDDYMTIFYPSAIMAVGGGFWPPAFSYDGVRVCQCRLGSHIRMTRPPLIVDVECHRVDRSGQVLAYGVHGNRLFILEKD